MLLKMKLNVRKMLIDLIENPIAKELNEILNANETLRTEWD